MDQYNAAGGTSQDLRRKKSVATMVMLAGLIPTLAVFCACQIEYRHWEREYAALRAEAYNEAEKELANRDASALGELSEPEMAVLKVIEKSLNRGCRMVYNPADGKIQYFRVAPTPAERDFIRKNKALAIGIVQRLPQTRAVIADLLPDWAGGRFYTGSLENPDVEPPPGQVARDQSEAWLWRSEVLPVLLEVLFALPWLWYFVLARIAELSIAVRGRA